jgi:hypothetical protein
MRRWRSTHTRDLLEVLNAACVEVPGANKASTLSVMLSKAAEFVSDRKSGWSFSPAIKRERRELPPDLLESGGATVK